MNEDDTKLFSDLGSPPTHETEEGYRRATHPTREIEIREVIRNSAVVREELRDVGKAALDEATWFVAVHKIPLDGSYEVDKMVTDLKERAAQYVHHLRTPVREKSALDFLKEYELRISAKEGVSGTNYGITELTVNTEGLDERQKGYIVTAINALIPRDSAICSSEASNGTAVVFLPNRFSDHIKEIAKTMARGGINFIGAANFIEEERGR